MKKIWENYKSTIILLVAMIVGAIIGLVAEKSNCFKSVRRFIHQFIDGGNCTTCIPNHGMFHCENETAKTSW